MNTVLGKLATEGTSYVQPIPHVNARTVFIFLLLVFLGALAKGVGFLREIVLAAQFGANRQMDAFIVGQTFPGVVQRMFDELLGASLLPLFATWVVAAGEPAAWARLNRLLWLFFIVSCGGVLGSLLLAKPMIGLLAPGLDAAGASMSARLLQIMLPSIAFIVFSSVYTGLLNYYRRFLWAALISLLSNVAGLLCIVLYADQIGVYSAALGVTLGALLLALLQWPFLPAAGRRQHPVAEAQPWLAEFSRLGKPLAVGIVIFNFIPLVERFLSSWLPEGNIAVLNYAFKIDWMVYIVFVLPITAMVFPQLAKAGAAGDRERFLGVLVLALKGVLLMLLPVMVLLLVEGDAVVRLLYERGSFTPSHTVQTVAVLRVYVLGLPGAAATLILFYAFYALKEPMARIAAGALGVVVASGCGWVFLRLWGASGIAGTHVLNMSIMAIFLGWSLNRILTPGWWRSLGFFTVRAVLAGMVTFPLSWLTASSVERVWTGTSVAWQAGRIVACSLVTAMVFLCLCWLLRLSEVRTLTMGLLNYLFSLAGKRPGVQQ